MPGMMVGKKNMNVQFFGWQYNQTLRSCVLRNMAANEKDDGKIEKARDL
jgi:hypothetical protein